MNRRDAVDTAQQFHQGLDNRASWLFSTSRERRARRMDHLAVTLFMTFMAAFGCIVMLLTQNLGGGL